MTNCHRCPRLTNYTKGLQPTLRGHMNSLSLSLCHWLPVRFYLDDSQWQSRGDFCDFCDKNPHQQRQQNNSITTQSISIFNPGSGAVFFFFLATARLQVKRFKIIALCRTGCFSVRNNHYLYVEISCLFLLFFFVNCSDFSYIYIYIIYSLFLCLFEPPENTLQQEFSGLFVLYFLGRQSTADTSPHMFPFGKCSEDCENICISAYCPMSCLFYTFFSFFFFASVPVRKVFSSSDWLIV